MKDMRLVSEEGSSKVRRQLFLEREYDQHAYGAPIIDVITNVGQMAIEFGIIREWGNRVLCLRHEDGEVAPLAMSGFWDSAGWPLGRGPEGWPESLWHQFPPSFFRDAWRERLRRLKLEDERIDWVYFGSPTTPVTSYLLPGRYIFAGDGPMLPRRKRDSGVFSIPPTYNPQLTRF